VSAALVAVFSGVGATSFASATAWLFKSLMVLKTAVASIEAQHVNNGGSTLRDAIDRIESKVDSQGSKLHDHLLVSAAESALLKQHLEQK
jgi:hypothetical protein